MADPLNNNNWAVWKVDMECTFKLCYLSGYVSDDIKRPDSAYDPISAENWEFNDTYATRIIFSNITAAQKLHAG